MSATGDAMARSLGIIERWAKTQGLLAGPVLAEIVELWACRQEYEMALEDMIAHLMEAHSMSQENDDE